MVVIFIFLNIVILIHSRISSLLRLLKTPAMCQVLCYILQMQRLINTPLIN